MNDTLKPIYVTDVVPKPSALIFFCSISNLLVQLS